METQPLSIDIVSDTICPWCHIGRARLKRALAERPDIEPSVRWRAYQLNPEMPADGMDRAAYLAAKFGGPERAKEVYAPVLEAFAAEGLTIAPELMARTPNTVASHCVVRWARGAGLQGEAVARLFKAYFEEGRDVGDHGVLAELAGEIGLDPDIVRGLLDKGEDREAVLQEDAQARRWGVTGVPAFIFGGRLMVMGAQAPEILSNAFDKALELAATEAEGAAGAN